jgi:two-component system CheB/CheR fusion protein
MEENKMHSEAGLQILLDYANSIIATLREPFLVLDKQLRVITANQSFYTIFQVTEIDTINRMLPNLGNSQWNIPLLIRLLKEIIPEKKIVKDYEVEHKFEKIGKRLMILNACQLRVPNKIAAVIAAKASEELNDEEELILLAIEDITVRKKYENGLKKANSDLEAMAVDLKRVAQVKSEFLANMSHELRTPINSINGFSEVLQDETFGPLNEKQKKYINNVLTSGKHLLLLINQMLDMAKAEAGIMHLELTEVPLKILLTEAAVLIEDLAGKKKIAIELDIAEDITTIEADDFKVKEIVYNLLTNSVKFTPDGGKIGIRAIKNGPTVEIVVWDTGIGIAHENMDKLFQGFFRVDTPYSRITDGTGLGLPLAKKLVELHGGKLSVESEGLDRGTSVWFTLPIVSKKMM